MAELDRLSCDEIIELDRKLRECALLIMEPYRDMKTNMRKTTESNLECLCDIQSNLSEYDKAFRKLYGYRFPKVPEKVIDLAVGSTSDRIVDLFDRMPRSQLTRPEMQIIFPISYYVLIMNNCFNKYVLEKKHNRIKNAISNQERALRELANKRVEEGHKIQSKTLSNKRRTNKETWHLSFDDLYKLSQKELCTINRRIGESKTKESNNFDRRVFVFNVLYKKITRQIRKESLTAIRPDYLRQEPHINLAVNLSLRHENLIYYEESAIAGMFLKDILHVSKDSDKPLDRLLRLYIANEIDGILIRTGTLNKLPAEVFLGMDNALLKWYYEFEEKRICSEDRKKRFIETMTNVLEEKRKMINQLKVEDTLKLIGDYGDYTQPNSFNCTFESLYNDLEMNYKITHAVVDKLINYYLHTGTLKEGSSLVHTSLKYINNVTKCLGTGGCVKFSRMRTFNEEFLCKAVRGAFLENNVLCCRYQDVLLLNNMIEANKEAEKKS